MKTIDFKKDPTYKAKTTPTIIKVPKMLFVMVDGIGAPDSGGKYETEFQKAMQAIFGIVYTIKFWDKKFTPPANYDKFTMAPIEALWWMDDGSDFDMEKPDDWHWTAMMRLPEFVTPEFYDEVVRTCIEQKKTDIYKKVRLEYFEEGESVQIMHVGPYSSEGPNIKRIHEYAIENGYKLIGRHHELYFGDPRRTAPEKLKTILRQPIKK